MKTISSIIAAASLLLHASNARAASVVVGTITNFSAVTISLTITTNAPPTTKGNTTKNATGSVKLSNATLLALFATWTTNNLSNWTASGAQLVFDWDTYQIDVVDKTGANVLFFAGNGVTNLTVTAYFYLDFLYQEGPYTET